ncbi:hypothetical protein ACIQWR_27910 [Streptomyces sp. NPDC098789]|uniref:hypothetical protein n=1 Tax=Streptomyces sp. NPDC098789 TaxID=3366098 RepID=UPI0037FCA03A
MGSGPAPRGALAACAATLLAAALTGCSGPDRDAGHDTAPERASGPAAGTPPPATGAAPAPRPTPPEDLCTALITHWAGVALDGDGAGGDPVGLDYQSMGLSGDQYEILRAVLADARAERRAEAPEGTAAADAAARRLAARGARERCAAHHRSAATATATGGPWG